MMRVDVQLVYSKDVTSCSLDDVWSRRKVRSVLIDGEDSFALVSTPYLGWLQKNNDCVNVSMVLSRGAKRDTHAIGSRETTHRLSLHNHGTHPPGHVCEKCFVSTRWQWLVCNLGPRHTAFASGKMVALLLGFCECSKIEHRMTK
jgi:hypothetical protein